MGIVVQPYTDDRIPAVTAFNRRLATGGYPPEFCFPESPVPHWLPREPGSNIFQEYFLAVEDEAVRGGFILKHQAFMVAGKEERVTYYHLPLSEGVVNKAYATAGVLMLRSALKMQPRLFALGMGGFHNPLPTMLKAMGWRLSEVPFLFKVLNPNRFLLNIALLKTSAPRILAARFAAYSGAGWLGIKSVQSLRSAGTGLAANIEIVKTFESWADDLWRSCAPSYSLIATRDSAVLNRLYPSTKNFVIITVVKGSQILGWAVLLDTQMSRNKYFGDLRVGSIVDCLSAPENAALVIQGACLALRNRGVDLVIANHSHGSWLSAFRTNGFWSGPSNFIFAGSKSLMQQLHASTVWQNQMYFMRGDGDGPINL